MSDTAVWTAALTAALTAVIIVAAATIERRLVEIRDELRKLNRRERER